MAEEKKHRSPSNFATMTPEEHKAACSRGGQKSGETRRRKKTMREAMEVLLSVKVKDPNLKQEMKDYGIKGSDMDNQMALVFKQFIKALGGSTRAAEFFADVLGESSKTKETNALGIEEEDDPMTKSIKDMLGEKE